MNLDADIIFCCGFSKRIEKSGNLLLNFLNEECGFHFERQSDKNWIYYDKEQNKVAINDYHLSVRYYSPRTLYTQLVEDYLILSLRIQVSALTTATKILPLYKEEYLKTSGILTDQKINTNELSHRKLKEIRS